MEIYGNYFRNKEGKGILLSLLSNFVVDVLKVTEMREVSSDPLAGIRCFCSGHLITVYSRITRLVEFSAIFQ